MTTLRDLTATLDAAVDDTLGDAITYTPDGGTPLSFNAWVTFADRAISTSGSQTTVEAISIEVRKAAVPTPGKGDRITIDVLPGATYWPKAIAPDETGSRWVLNLAKVAA